jgi:hypothetical protein
MSDLGKKIQYIFMNVASIFALFDEVQKSESTLSTEFLNKIGYYYSRISNDYLAKKREKIRVLVE